MDRSILKKIDKLYSSSTKKGLIRIVDIIKKIYGIEYFDLDIMDAKNINMLAKYLSKFKISTQDTYLGYIGMLYDLYDKCIPTELNRLSKRVRKSVSSHHQSKKSEPLKELDLNCVKNVLNQKRLKKGNYINYRKWLVVCIICDIPLRLNEMCEMKYEDDGIHNYIDFKKGKAIIRNHKSSTSFGIKTLKLSKTLIDEIKEYKKKFDYEYLFMVNKYPFDKPMLGVHMNQLWATAIKTYYKSIGEPYVPFGIHDCRHQYTTNKCNEINVDVDTIKKILEIQKEMGHTRLETTLTHYLKTKTKTKTKTKK